MFGHYPQISKQGVLQCNTCVLPHDVNKIINSFFPRMVYCRECCNTVRFNTMMRELGMADEIKHTPAKCRQDKLVVCSVCHNTTLCGHHAGIARTNGTKHTTYGQLMCSDCCWNEIT